jgi:hypothetical protein
MVKYTSTRSEFITTKQSAYLRRLCYDIPSLQQEYLSRNSKEYINDNDIAILTIPEQSFSTLSDYISIIEDTLIEPIVQWPQTKSVSIDDLPDYPSINLVSAAFSLNKKQYVMFSLALRALLKTWLIRADRSNEQPTQFFGYLGK